MKIKYKNINFLRYVSFMLLLVALVACAPKSSLKGMGHHLAPSSFFSINDFYIHNLSSAKKINEVIPSFYELRSTMVHSYKNEEVGPYVEKVFASLLDKNIYSFNPINIQGANTVKFLDVFNASVNPNLLLFDKQAIGIASDYINLHSEADAFYLLFKAALLEFADSDKTNQIMQELFPEQWINGRTPFSSFNREMLLLSTYYRKFFTDNDFLTESQEVLNLAFKNVLIDSFGQNPSMLHHYALNKFMLMMHEDISSDQKHRWFPVTHMIVNLLLDPDTAVLNTTKICKFLRDSELSEGAQRYILKCISNKRNDIRKNTAVTVKQNIAGLIEVLSKQHKNLELALDFRQEASWWALYPKHAAEATKVAKSIVRAWSKDLLVRTGRGYFGHKTSLQETQKVNVSFDYSLQDAYKFYDDYELKDDLLKYSVNDEDMARNIYKGTLTLITDSIKEAIQNEAQNKIIANSLWILHNRRMSHVGIENVNVSFIGEGGWKMAFRVEVTLSDGRVYPFVLKGIKPDYGFDFSPDISEELFRHQYYSGLGYSRFGVSAKVKGITLVTEEYLPEARIDTYLQNNQRRKLARIDYYMDMYNDRTIAHKREIWRKAAVASFSGMLRSYLYNNEYIRDPKPSNVIIEELVDKSQAKKINSIFFDTGEFGRVGPKETLQSISEGLIKMLVEGSFNGQIKGVETLHPELQLTKKNGKTINCVGMAEILLAIDDVTDHNKMLMSKIFKEKTNKAFFRVVYGNIENKIDSYHDARDINSFLRVLSCFPAAIKDTKAHKTAVRVLEDRSIQLDPTYRELIALASPDFKPLLALESAA